MTYEPPRSPAGKGRGPSRKKRARQRTGPGPRDPVQAASVISEKLSIPGLGEKLTEYRIKKAWPRAVGQSIARKARPERLIRGTLYVTVSSAPWASELNYQKRELIKAVNRVEGAEVVSDIVLKTGRFKEEAAEAPAAVPVPEISEIELSDEESRRIDETVASIKDPGLREAVRRAMIRAAADGEAEG